MCMVYCMGCKNISRNLLVCPNLSMRSLPRVPGHSGWCSNTNWFGERKKNGSDQKRGEGRWIRRTYTYSVQLTRPDCHWHFFLGSWGTVIHFWRSSMATCVVAYKAKIVKSWRKICLRITVFWKIPIFSSHFNSPLQSKLKPRASVDKKCHRYCQASNVELPVTRSFLNINPPKSVVNAKIRFWKEQFKYGNYVFLLDVGFQ